VTPPIASTITMMGATMDKTRLPDHAALDVD